MVALAAHENGNREAARSRIAADTHSIPQHCLALGHSYRSPGRICSVIEVWVLEGGVEREKTQSSFLKWRKASGARETCITPSHCLVRPPVKEVSLSLGADALSLFNDGWEALAQMNALTGARE